MERHVINYYSYYLFFLITYFLISLYVFMRVDQTSGVIVDELFHIPQGQLYCNGNFSYWDPKITTLPGLYYISTIVGTYFECNTYNLRLVNLIASCVNFTLFASILKFVYYNHCVPCRVLVQAFSLAILPPLYFFSHVYYTDTLSLTFILLFSRLCFTNKYKSFILIFGICSILMRQTNVVWVAMVFGHKCLDLLIKSSRVFGNQYITEVRLSKQSLIAKDVDNSKVKRYYGPHDLYYALKYHFGTYFTTFFKFLTFQDILALTTHLIIITSFAAFVYVNGSIVVGDKTAHEATIHTPQLLYFLIFYGVFGLPYVVFKLKSTLKLIYRRKLLTIIIAILFTAMVHFNTEVHPYLLADNRHFTFYIWNRWYGKYDFARYATIPVYVFLLFSLYDNLKRNNCIAFVLPYIICLMLVLGLQKLIEIRYFLVPYLVLRLRFEKPQNSIIVTELLWYIILNIAAFNVFFNKEIQWDDFDYPQRIIW